MTDISMRKTWDKSQLGVYIVLALAMACGFGYSLCAYNNRGDNLALIDGQRKERAAMTRLHKAEVAFLRERNMDSKRIIEKQSDQLAAANIKSSDTAKAAIDAVNKDNPK